MYQKLFQITLVLLLVAVSIAMVGLVINAVLSAMSSSPLLARDQDMVFVVASVSMRQIGFMIVAASPSSRASISFSVAEDFVAESCLMQRRAFLQFRGVVGACIFLTSASTGFRKVRQLRANILEMVNEERAVAKVPPVDGRAGDACRHQSRDGDGAARVCKSLGPQRIQAISPLFVCRRNRSNAGECFCCRQHVVQQAKRSQAGYVLLTPAPLGKHHRTMVIARRSLRRSTHADLESQSTN